MATLAVFAALVGFAHGTPLTCQQAITAQVGLGDIANYTFTAPTAGLPRGVTFSTCGTVGDTIIRVDGGGWLDGDACGLNEELRLRGPIAAGESISVETKWLAPTAAGSIIILANCTNPGLGTATVVTFGTSSPAGGELANAGRASIYAMPGTRAYSHLVAARGLRLAGIAGTAATMTPDANYSLAVLAGLVAQGIPGTEMVLAQGWLSQPSTTPLPAPTLANVGRSLRLQLWNLTTDLRDPAGLGTLAGLALAAGFDWVEWADPGYITVSTRPDSCQTDVDVLFLLDGSGSIANAWADEVDFVASVARYGELSNFRHFLWTGHRGFSALCRGVTYSTCHPCFLDSDWCLPSDACQLNVNWDQVLPDRCQPDPGRGHHIL